MSITIDRLKSESLLDSAKAEKLAARLNSEPHTRQGEDEQWTYRAVSVGADRFKVMVIDEDGNELGFL
jgi:hypothetical protein